MSRCLAERSIDHVVLERGEVANSWRTERWDSLRLLTPNWQSRLPGFGYEGDDPDGFRTMPETIALHRALRARRFARRCGRTCRVTSVRAHDDGYEVVDAAGHLALRGGRARDRRVQHRRRCRRSRRRCRRAIAQLTTAPVPQSRAARSRRRAGRRRVRHRRADRRRDPALRPAGDAGGRRARARAARSTAAGTSSGGWTPPACSTSATTRSTTS